MYCPNCGSDNPPDGKFCRHCGIGLAAVSAALLQKPGDTTAPTSKLAELIKGYNSGQNKMMFGGGSIALGAVATVFLLMTGLWGFFWIFFWPFMGLFGGGADQFRRGWSRWSKATSELKALGYQKPAGAFTPQTESESTPFTESRTTTALPSGLHLSGPPSVTESTTRHLDTRNGE